MKPYYTNEMLVTMTAEEAGILRAATDHMRHLWNDTDENGNRKFPEQYGKYNQLYEDLTEILEHIPF